MCYTVNRNLRSPSVFLERGHFFNYSRLTNDFYTRLMQAVETCFKTTVSVPMVLHGAGLTSAHRLTATWHEIVDVKEISTNNINMQYF